VSHNGAMTVAAVILASSTEEALLPIDGLPAVRRLVDLAWSGGALPIVVVCSDAAALGPALAGATATPTEPPQAGEVAALLHGAAVAASEVRETTAFLAWPAAQVWVGAETVTSLIEAHGVAPDVMVVPTWQNDPGWPILLPATALDGLGQLPGTLPVGDAVAQLGSAGLGAWPVGLGDPGTVLDAATPRDQLPEYSGPPAPVSGRAHEWGDAVEAAENTDADVGPSPVPWRTSPAETATETDAETS
jgi:CTP:molybdopterin cytidylyltransferase MocA